MAEYISEARMKRYFTKSNAWRYATLFFVIGVLFIGASYLLQTNDVAYEYYARYVHNIPPSSFIYGVAIAISLGIIIIMVAYSTTPSNAEYDAWVESRKQMILNSALDKLRISPHQVVSNPYIPKPLIFEGFIYPFDEDMQKKYNTEHDKGKKNQDNIRYKMSIGGKIRFSINTVLYIVLVEDYIAAFYSDINALEQSRRYQETYHYYYHDIVGITTDDQQSLWHYHLKKIALTYQSFSIEVSSGESLEINVLIDAHFARMRDVRRTPPLIVLDSEVDQAISNLLMFLRDKKQGKVNPALPTYPTRP